ncbi:HetZ-related protein 2 [Alkalinema pantanalense CENA528]|uniref:HetZ-related protein 2 n=1 Tax=Alkalinema pantanalense TaxID=1620705 RepID=UPI003D701176
MTLADKLAQEWRSQLQADLPGHASAHEAIVAWLLGENQDQFDTFTHVQLDIARQAMDYRYRILRDRYLNASPERAYRNLIQRLSGLFLLRNKIKTWISLSRDRQRTVVDVLQEVIQELMQQDSYLQQQTAWISQCTTDPRLRNALVLAATEEYCLRPIRNQPLLMYRFVNYLRRSQRGGMTQVPTADFIRLVSEEVNPDDADGSVSLLDGQAISDYQDAQAQAEQREVRDAVVGNLAAYLDEKVGPEASAWLKLYLQGKTQETIAEALNMPIKQVYRLREKVSYHATKVFAAKKKPELVAEWLGS